MTFALSPLFADLTKVVAATNERFWGLGETGLAVVLFLTVFLVIVVGWLLHNTGRRD